MKLGNFENIDPASNGSKKYANFSSSKNMVTLAVYKHHFLKKLQLFVPFG